MVAIYSRSFDTRCTLVIRRLVEVLEQWGVEVLVYRPFYDFLLGQQEWAMCKVGTFGGHDDLPRGTRFLVSVGGDGTFLHSILLVRESGIPVVGVNMGRLGFLAHFGSDDLQASVGHLLSGALPVEDRTLLEVSVDGHPADVFPYALNDMVIQKRTAGLMTVHAWCDDEFLNSYWADGLIVATPTGSSAYSLSVGGPIVAPKSQNFIVSPIAAHNLNVRPLVLPDDVVLRLRAECRDSDGRFTLSLDSRSVECVSGTELTLRRAGFTVKVVKSSSFYATLRGKLMWGMDKRN